MQLYIHIPFCVKKCAYCDFLSFAADEQTQGAYVKALQKELEFYGEKYSDRFISTIFIGGGTPSWLNEKDMAAIMECVYRNFEVAADAEITIECNPGTVSEQKFAVYKSVGINRLSIGLQSANNEELKTLGRIHTFEQFLRTYDKARHHGFANINVDLMSSLPGQRPEDFVASLKKVTRLKPEHISAYSLIIEEGTPFYEKYEADAKRQAEGVPTEFLPTEEEEYETTKRTQQILQSEGYHWYEISNFAKPGRECQHNIGYWKRADYLGLGLGAASLIDNVRYANTTDIYEYMKCPQEAAAGEAVSRDAQMEEFMFLGLRMIDGFHREEFEKTFGVAIEGVYGAILKGLQQEELLLQREGRIRLTEKGIDVSNYALSQFLLS
ncbi:MAG: oxygen-independent coproporphyrinogen III oxidase [Roseburia sp.]|nr:oxygen-independent coproporphyrinogen III oxidase [Roseburia sp.]